MFQFLRIGTVIFVLSFAFAVHAQEGMIKGMITDSEGAAIGKARVLLHWDSVGSQGDLKTNIGIREDRVAITDKDGHFEIRLPWGFYDVLVSASVFSPRCRKIRVKGDVDLQMKLDVDPLVTEELGGMLVSPASQR